MANHKSAKKRARQDIVRNARNKAYLSKVRTTIKKFRLGAEELAAGKIEAPTVAALLKDAQSSIAKAASKGMMHRNGAARRISRLTQAFAVASKK